MKVKVKWRKVYVILVMKTCERKTVREVRRGPWVISDHLYWWGGERVV